MNGMNEKAILRVNPDGDVITCAKGDVKSCGWSAGDKVCGKCGAMAVMTKDAASDSEDVIDELSDTNGEAEKAKLKKKPVADLENVGDAATDAGTEADDVAKKGVKPTDAEEAAEGAADNPLEEGAEEGENELQRQAKIKKARKARLGGMGVKDANGDEGTFLCGISRKMHPNGAEPCEGCPGGCYPVFGMPDLLAVEGLAMQEFGGKVLDSGYSSQYDTFVVDVLRKDGRIIEAYYDGQGESEGWHPLPDDSITYSENIISGDDAVITAIGHVNGKSLGLSVLVVDDAPAYRVEVDGADGYSYDVFVGMDGKVLGVDQYEYEVKAAPVDDMTAALMEFEALATEAELRDQGLI